MEPPATAMLPGTTAAAGQVPGTNLPIPGMFPNMLPLASGQFGVLPVMPIQAMTHKATRHARRVYVGGLPANANEHGMLLSMSINYEKKFVFVEMRTLKEASNAMALDGIIFEVVYPFGRKQGVENYSFRAIP
ncbi:splicing factor U2af large subunit B-like [Nicotiana tabacum]|uniref:Splicing factor U2af large subunit B-like n=1 Tax=Nicotiana tabacum TaxID=4097 RepID=A0AC58T3Z1_TOBAC